MFKVCLTMVLLNFMNVLKHSQRLVNVRERLYLSNKTFIHL